MIPDIGFLELFIILMVALVVIGPKQMPVVARKIGVFIGKVKKAIDSLLKAGE